MKSGNFERRVKTRIMNPFANPNMDPRLSIASGAPVKNNTRFPHLVITLLFALRIIRPRCFTTRTLAINGV